jgi:hypothetical protein
LTGLSFADFYAGLRITVRRQRNGDDEARRQKTAAAAILVSGFPNDDWGTCRLWVSERDVIDEISKSERKMIRAAEDPRKAREVLRSAIGDLNTRIYEKYCKDGVYPLYVFFCETTGGSARYMVFYVTNPTAARMAFEARALVSTVEQNDLVRDTIAYYLSEAAESDAERELVKRLVTAVPREDPILTFKSTRSDLLPNVRPVPDYYIRRPEILSQLRSLVLQGSNVEPFNETHHHSRTALKNVVGTAIASLKRLRPTRRVVGICGGAGVGKSLLLAEVAWDADVRTHFKKSITRIWLRDSGYAATAAQAFLADRMETGQHAFRNAEHGRSELARISRDKVHLVLLDDVKNKLDIEAFDQLGAGCIVVFTCRDRTLAKAYDPLAIEVGLLGSGQASQLLQSASDSLLDMSDAFAKKVLEHCAGHPLGLVVTGSMAKNTKMSWESIWYILQKPLSDEFQAIISEYDFPNVFTSIHASASLLGQTTQSCFSMLACMPNNVAVPKTALQTIWAINEHEVEYTVYSLANLYLADVDENQHLTLHSLLLGYLRRRESQRLTTLQIQLLERYRKKCPNGKWHEGPDDGYFLLHLPYHLIQAEHPQELADLLTGSPDWEKACMTSRNAQLTTYWNVLDDALAYFARAKSPGNLLTQTALFCIKQVSYICLLSHNEYDIESLVWLGREAEALAAIETRESPKWQYEALRAYLNASLEKGMPKPQYLSRLENLAIATSEALDDEWWIANCSRIHAHHGDFPKANALISRITQPEIRVVALCRLAVDTLTSLGSFDAGLAARFLLAEATRCLSRCAGATRFAPMYWIAYMEHLFKNEAQVRHIYNALSIAKQTANRREMEEAWEYEIAIELYIFKNHAKASISISALKDKTAPAAYGFYAACNHEANMAVALAVNGEFDASKKLLKDLEFHHDVVKQAIDVASYIWQKCDSSVGRQAFTDALNLHARYDRDQHLSRNAVSYAALSLCRLGEFAEAGRLLDRRHKLAQILSSDFWIPDYMAILLASNMAEAGYVSQALSLSHLVRHADSVSVFVPKIIPYARTVEHCRLVESMILTDKEKELSEFDMELLAKLYFHCDQVDQYNDIVAQLTARTNTSDKLANPWAVEHLLSVFIETGQGERAIALLEDSSGALSPRKMAENLSTALKQVRNFSSSPGLRSRFLDQCRKLETLPDQDQSIQACVVETLLYLEEWSAAIQHIERLPDTHTRISLGCLALSEFTHQKNTQYLERIVQIVTDSLRSAASSHDWNYHVCKFVRALVSAGRLSEAKNFADQIRDRRFLLISLGAMARAIEECSGELDAAPIWKRISESVPVVFQEVMSSKKEAHEFFSCMEIVTDMAASNRMSGVLNLHFTVDPDGLIEMFATLFPHFESVEKGLGLSVLRETLRILSWYPEFNEMESSLAPCLNDTEQ